ncbi:MAG: hypothetical protein OIN66_15105 [Candidatus Methanoperedens sp.]|nr:hypothetical protein [Candidatus Methanoperedens sp.]
MVQPTCSHELINFEFDDPRGAFGKAALRKWDHCAGERIFMFIPANEGEQSGTITETLIELIDIQKMHL